MADFANSSIQRVVHIRELKWSHAEKVFARQAFDLALCNELQATIQEAKECAAKIQGPSELWELERERPKTQKAADSFCCNLALECGGSACV